MSSAGVDVGDVRASATRRQVWAWGLWNWGSAAYGAVILTFVYSVYLTDDVGDRLPGPLTANAWLGFALGAAGLTVALIAPVAGQRADAGGHRKRSLAIWTSLVVLSVIALFWVQDSPGWFWYGLAIFAFASVVNEFAEVSYNAMIRQVSSPETIGRVSGFGWSMGYFGGILLLLAVYLGLIAGDGGSRGLLGVSTDDGLNIRVVALVCAVWFFVFALPVQKAVPEVEGLPKEQRLGFRASYRKLWTDLRELHRTSRQTTAFLIASAIYRDGLAATFTFGAVIAVTVYDIDEDDVLIFGVVANVTSALGALVGGRVDDRKGPRPVIMTSLIGMIVSGTILLFLSGPLAFWIFGLALTLFVGPAQSASRTFLARVTPPGREGQMFGLYATTGRAVSFLAPVLVGAFTAIFGTDRAGMVGILLVLVVGAYALTKVAPPSREKTC